MEELRPLLLPVTEAARLLATSRSKIYEMIAVGQLESVKLGRRRLIPREAVESYVASLRGLRRIAGATRGAADRKPG